MHDRHADDYRHLLHVSVVVDERMSLTGRVPWTFRIGVRRRRSRRRLHAFEQDTSETVAMIDVKRQPWWRRRVSLTAGEATLLGIAIGSAAAIVCSLTPPRDFSYSFLLLLLLTIGTRVVTCPRRDTTGYGMGTSGTRAGTPTFGRPTASGASPAPIRSAAVANTTFIWRRWLESYLTPAVRS